jgi:hypothetical protein
VDEEVTLIEHTRRQLARILRTLPAEAFARTGVYRHDGKDEERSLERLLTLVTNHVLHHVRFIAEKRKALGLPA